MAARKPFLLRLDPALLESLRRLAAQEMRSLNGQIEYILRDWLRRTGMGPKGPMDGGDPARRPTDPPSGS